MTKKEKDSLEHLTTIVLRIEEKQDEMHTALNGEYEKPGLFTRVVTLEEWKKTVQKKFAAGLAALVVGIELVWKLIVG